MPDVSIEFARPQALWLLLLLPLVLLIGLRFGVKRNISRRSTWLRVSAVALVCLALAEPLLGTSDSATSTIFVIDRSSSIDSSTASLVNDWVNDALNAGGSSDRAAVIAFGAEPDLVSEPVSVDDLDSDVISAGDVRASATNIETALAMARTLPMSGERRLVLVSDGAENSGSAIAQSSQLAADQTPVDVLQLSGISSDDFRIDGVSAPESVWQGEQVNLLVSVASSVETDGAVVITVGDHEPEVHEVHFDEGLSTQSFTLEELDAGFHPISVHVNAVDGPDTFQENNDASRSLVVRESPALLLVSAEQGDSSYIRNALESRGALVTATPPSGIPERLSELTAFDVVLLNNVPAGELTVGQVAALDSLTREFGRGLVVIGGSSAYGPGGYAATPLEEMLPVSIKVTDGKQRQRVALMLIVDKSGSMAYDPLQTSSKIEMAREAVRLAASALSDGDQLGILVFNDNQQWIVHLEAIEGEDDRIRIDAAIETIDADGGTEIYPALEVGFDAISQSSAEVRHVILLSDGKSSTGTRESYERLIEEFRQNNTTLSTISIGDDADTDLLQFLAEEGNGNYHPTERPEDIPSITLAEAESAGNQSIINGSFLPIQVGPSPILTGFEPESLPMIDRYDYSELKENAQGVLNSRRDDPVLAKWQYGLGRVVAWTADDGIDFAQDWRAWPEYADFWTSIVRWSLPDPENGPVNVEVSREGTDAVLTVNTQSAVGDYVDLHDALAMVTGPDGAVTSDLPLFQSGPGEYQLRIADPLPGAYKFELASGNLQAGQTALTGFALPASPELQPSTDTTDLLASIAGRTGGRVLTFDSPGDVFDLPSSSVAGVTEYSAIWWIPLSLALLFFLTELALRYNFAAQLHRFTRN